MDIAVSSALSKVRRQSLFSLKSSGHPEDYDSEGFRKLRYRQFTKKSFERLLIKEEEEKLEEAERKLRSQEAHLKDGELKFGIDFYEGLRPDRNPDLEEGQILRSNYGIPPLHLLGVPLEEVDEGISGKTFVVMARRLHRIYIARFSATPSFFIIPVWNPIRKWAVFIYTHQIFDFLILFTILVNCILLAFPEEQVNSSTEVAFLFIYFLEMLTKMVARGLFAAKYTYLRDPWNWLDLLVVISGIPNLVSPSFNSGKSAAVAHGSTSAAVQALRSFRVLRAVKTISIFPGLKTIVTAILRAMRMLGEVVLLTIFCLCVFSLLSVHFYKGTLRQKCVKNPETLIHLKKNYENYDYFYHRVVLNSDNWDKTRDGEYMLCGNASGAGGCREGYICLPNVGDNPNFGFTSFDNIIPSMMITFQLMTIDFWENAYQKVLWTNGVMTVVYFIILVFFGSFYLLNLMLAVVNITYQEEARRTCKELEKERVTRANKQKIKTKFYKLMKKHGAFSALLKINLEKHRREKRLQNIITHWQIATYVSKKLQTDPDCVNFLRPFVTEGRDVRDIFENVAYSLKRWQSLYRQHKNEAAVRKLSTSVDSAIYLGNASKSLSGTDIRYLTFSRPDQSNDITVQKGTGGSAIDDLQHINNSTPTADGKAEEEKEFTLSVYKSNKTATLSPKGSVLSIGTIKSVTIEDPKPLPLSAKDKVLSGVISGTASPCKTPISSTHGVPESEQIAEVLQLPRSSHLSVPQAACLRRHTITTDVCDFPVLGSRSRLVTKSSVHLRKRDKFECPFSSLKEMRDYLRMRVHQIVTDIFFDLFINLCIILNTLVLSLQFHGMSSELRTNVDIINIVFSAIFVTEAAMKLFGLGISGYFSISWNIFDFIIVQEAILTLMLSKNELPAENVLRVCRLFRIFKLAQVWPAMNMLVTVIMKALGAVGQLIIILFIILYIFAVIGLQLFRELYVEQSFPYGTGVPRWNFKDFFHSFLMMFRVLCGEWIEPLWDCMRIPQSSNVYCYIIFMPMLIFGNFVVLNLFLALLLNAFGDNDNLKESVERIRLENAKKRLQFMWKRILKGCCCFGQSINLQVNIIIHKPIGAKVKEAETRISCEDKKILVVTEDQHWSGGSELLSAPSCFPSIMFHSKKFQRQIDRFNESSFGRRWMQFRFSVMKMIYKDWFEFTVLVLIICSSIILAFEDYEYRHITDDNNILKFTHSYLNTIFTYLFIFEMLFRWIGDGWTVYFTNIWTILDFIVVVVSTVNLFPGDDDDSGSGLQGLRALRALRPLRVVSRIQGMKIVVNSLMRAIPAIINVFMVSLVVWLIFSVMGVQFFSGKFYKCVYLDNNTIVSGVRNKTECNGKAGTLWRNSNINFDNVLQAFLALFQVATFEGWMEVMRDGIDAKEVDVQPEREFGFAYYIYFVIFIVIGNFFSLNLLVGVIIDNFNDLKKQYEGSFLDAFLTPNQRNYYSILKKLSAQRPKKIIEPPKWRFQQVFYDLAVSDRFELLLMGVVCLNMVALIAETISFKPSCAAIEVYFIIEIGFCTFFVLEVFLKIFGLRQFYFYRIWNLFDFLVAIITSAGVILEIYEITTESDIYPNDPVEYNYRYGFLISPNVLRLVRFFRISRALRAVKVAKGLHKVMFSLLISLPAIMNIMALLLLCIFIYAIFGMFLFGHVKLTGSLTEMMNFRSLSSSMLVLLSLSTAAGWNDILDPLLIQEPFCNRTHHQLPNGLWVKAKNGDCGVNYAAIPYMVSFIIITYLCLINMYIAVILENYDQAHQQDEIGVTEDDFDMFYKVWQRYDPEATQFIYYRMLSDFVADLDDPIGIEKPNEIAIAAMNIPILKEDKLHCLDILLCLVKRVLFWMEESEDMTILMGSLTEKFRMRFPTRAKDTVVSSTLRRKKEDVAARTLQKAWREWKMGKRSNKHAIHITSEERLPQKSSSSGQQQVSLNKVTFNENAVSKNKTNESFTVHSSQILLTENNPVSKKQLQDKLPNNKVPVDSTVIETKESSWV